VNPNRPLGATRYDRHMAGPITMAVLRTLKPVVCPHCGTRQLRAPIPRVAYRLCKKCHRRFDERTRR